MRDDQVEAVREAAADAVSFDGFSVERLDERGGEYAVETNGDGRRRIHGDLRAALDEAADYVTNWYFWHAVAPQKDDRWAFLRWVERADDLDVERRYAAMREEELVRSWGQLRVTVALVDDGERRYAVRHENDNGRPVDELDEYDDPLEARSLAKRDGDGRYRPLKTAPTLRTGWRFRDLTGTELVETVDFFYPATVANWHREREGTLDVSHWRETAERQTGIYDLVDELDREAVDRLAAACCVDSQCLRRREWEFDGETGLAADGGDGPFPCREPCSLVIAAAREWTKLEREESRTYEFELTPGEKAQVEEILDAVADGRTDSIREADFGEGANRYRARYLREKLFDEDGGFVDVDTRG